MPNGFYYKTYAFAPTPIRLKSFWEKRATGNPNKLSKIKNVLYGYKLIKVIAKKYKTSCLFRNMDGKELLVSAENFILGLGAIENARFVKQIYANAKVNIKNNSNFGNFQEAPHFKEVATFKKGKKNLPIILLRGINVSEASGIGANKSELFISIVAWDGPGTPKVAFQIERLDKYWKRMPKISYENPYNLKPYPLKYVLAYKLKTLKTDHEYYLMMRCEQTPNKDSYMDFNEKETKLNWKITDTDFKCYSNYLRKFSSFLISNQYAKEVKIPFKESENYAVPDSAIGGPHHMSTVPLLKDNNLIDENFRLTKFKNIYVVGASGFPFAGSENPTVQAMNTALAAADHIINKKK